MKAAKCERNSGKFAEILPRNFPKAGVINILDPQITFKKFKLSQNRLLIAIV
jgi:hypothetical protein